MADNGNDLLKDRMSPPVNSVQSTAGQKQNCVRLCVCVCVCVFESVCVGVMGGAFVSDCEQPHEVDAGAHACVGFFVGRNAREPTHPEIVQDCIQFFEERALRWKLEEVHGCGGAIGFAQEVRAPQRSLHTRSTDRQHST